MIPFHVQITTSRSVVCLDVLFPHFTLPINCKSRHEAKVIFTLLEYWPYLTKPEDMMKNIIKEIFI